MFTRRVRATVGALLGIICLLGAASRPTSGQQPATAKSKGSAPLVAESIAPELREVARNFSALSPQEFLNWLLIVEPPASATSPEVLMQIVSGILEYRGLEILENGDALYHLSEKTLPLIKLFHREGQIRFVVIKDLDPLAEVRGGKVIVISTGFLAMIENEAELDGVIAHELAHEVFSTMSRLARERKDLRTARLCEAECDAVAALALRAIGLDPTVIAKFFRKIMADYPELSKLNDGSDDHPSFIARIGLNEAVTKSWKIVETASAARQTIIVERAGSGLRFEGAPPQGSHVNLPAPH